MTRTTATPAPIARTGSGARPVAQAAGLRGVDDGERHVMRRGGTLLPLRLPMFRPVKAVLVDKGIHHVAQDASVPVLIRGKELLDLYAFLNALTSIGLPAVLPSIVWQIVSL